MAFRATCYICARSFFSQDNRNAQRKHLTCGGICRLALRARRQRERRFRRRQNRLTNEAVQQTMLAWDAMHRKAQWKNSPSSTSKRSRVANGTGKRTISKAKSSANKTASPARLKRSRK